MLQVPKLEIFQSKEMTFYLFFWCLIQLRQFYNNTNVWFCNQKKKNHSPALLPGPFTVLTKLIIYLQPKCIRAITILKAFAQNYCFPTPTSNKQISHLNPLYYQKQDQGLSYLRPIFTSSNNYLNIKNSMSQQPKLPPPPMPYRFPFPYPPMMPEKLKGTQPIPGSNPIPQTSLPPNNNIPGAPPYMPPRLYNPYLGGYNMFPMGQHFPPYMPLGRNMPPPDSQENSKNQKIGEEKNGPPRPPFPRPGPPFFNPGMYYPPPFPNFPLQHPANQAVKAPFKNLSQETSISHPEPASKKEMRTTLLPPQLLTQQPIREQPKPKVKEVRHADVKAYQPEGPSKKKKKDIVIVQNRTQRETREKKQSIEKIMDMIMRERPLRDRIIKIGKEHQAVIPESFINEYEYNLKIKLQKKKSLLSRLVISV